MTLESRAMTLAYLIASLPLALIIDWYLRFQVQLLYGMQIGKHPTKYSWGSRVTWLILGIDLGLVDLGFLLKPNEPPALWVAAALLLAVYMGVASMQAVNELKASRQ